MSSTWSGWLLTWWNSEDDGSKKDSDEGDTPNENASGRASRASSDAMTRPSVYLRNAPEGSCVFEPFPGEPRLPINVRVHHARFVAKVKRKDDGISTVYTALRDSLRFWRRAETVDLHILNDISFTLRAGTSTLVLGAPGSGRSSLLKLLAGRLRAGKNSSLSGSVIYNGVDQSALEMTKIAAFVGQLDEHIALQTVRDIFSFAEQTAGSPQAFTRKSGKRCAEGTSAEDVAKALSGAVDSMLASLELSGAADTIIGNELFRGVSGGERKRTTLGEMLFGRQPLLLLDEISTGLDSATTFKLVQTLNASTRSMQSTMVISLLQPGPEVLKLFDDIILMGEGYLIYHGPMRKVQKYFASLGFTCAPGRSLGDFLVDLTTPRRRRYFAQGGAVPSTEALAKAWAAAAAAVDDEATDGSDSLLAEIPPFYLSGGSSYTLDARSDFKVAFGYVTRIYWSEKVIHFLLLVRTIILSVILGGIFYSLPTDPETDGDISWISNRLSAIFFAFFLFASGSFQALPFALATRDVLHKQLDAKMLRPATYVAADNLLMLATIIPPPLAVTTVVFWMTDLVDPSASDAGQVYGLFFAIGLCMNFVITSLTRLVAYSMPSLVTAFVLHATTVVGVLYFFSGIFVAEGTLANWLVWLLWLSPIGHGERAAAVAVFDSETFAGRGHLALEAYEIRSGREWIWVAFLYTILFGLLCILAQWVALRNLRFGQHRNLRGAGGPGWDEEEDMDAEDAEDDLEKAMAADAPRRKSAAGQDSSAIARLAMSMPRAQVNFSFRNISYVVEAKSSAPKQLLTDVTGHVTNGRMCAIIGATGAGKTTLLNQIALRKTSGQRSGELLVDGRLVTDMRAYRRQLGFCEQDDNHCAFSTVREAALFSATLRLPAGTPKEAIEGFVDAILETLELASISTSKIGVKGRGGLSVGQFKRLTVAVELAANPAILFLDEPTSGLDATAAEVTVRAVKRICAAGRTVLCTIHQPSREVFELFDDILLLQKGGRTAYHGPVDEMVAYFSRFEANTLPMPSGEFNPSIYALNVLDLGKSPDTDTDTEEGSVSSSREVDWADAYQESPERVAVLERIKADEDAAGTSARDEAAPERGVSVFVSTLALWARWRTAYWRTPEFTLLRTFALVSLMFLFGLTIFQTKSIDTVPEVQSYVGVLGFCLILACFVVALSCLDIMSKMRSVYYREASRHMYRTWAYASGSGLVELVYLAVTALCAVVPLYFVIGLRTDFEGCIALVCIFYASFLLFTSLTHFAVAATPNVRFAVLGIGLSVSVFILFAGFLISRDDVASGLRWVFSISPAYHILQAMMQSQLRCDCTADFNVGAEAVTCDGGLQCEDVCDLSLPGCNILEVSLPSGLVTKLTAWQFVQTNFEVADESWVYKFGNALAFAFAFKLFEFAALRIFKHDSS